MTATIERVTTPPPAPDAADVVARARRRRRRHLVDRVVISILLIAATVFTIYDVGATYYNNWHAYQFAQTTSEQSKQMPPEQSYAEMNSAHTYNENLPSTLLRDPIGAGTVNTPEYRAYLAELDEGIAMGTLRLPSIKSEMSILHGTSDSTLAQGAGHMFGTHFPIGGSGTHAGLAAHRGLKTMTAFDNLPDVKMGDLFYIEIYGKTLAYKVTDIQTVLPNDMGKMVPVEGKDLVTLVTCTPYGVNSHRLLVTGERTLWLPEEKAATQSVGFDWSIQEWMWTRVIIGGIVLAILLGCWSYWIVADVRNFRSRRTTTPSPASS